MGILIEGPTDQLQHRRGVVILPQQRRQHQREQQVRTVFHRKLLRKGVGPDFGIPPQNSAQPIGNVLPRLVHSPFSVGFVHPQKAQGMEIEKSGVLLAAIFHPPIQPG